MRALHVLWILFFLFYPTQANIGAVDGDKNDQEWKIVQKLAGGKVKRPKRQAVTFDQYGLPKYTYNGVPPILDRQQQYRGNRGSAVTSKVPASVVYTTPQGNCYCPCTNGFSGVFVPQPGQNQVGNRPIRGQFSHDSSDSDNTQLGDNKYQVNKYDKVHIDDMHQATGDNYPLAQPNDEYEPGNGDPEPIADDLNDPLARSHRQPSSNHGDGPAPEKLT